MSEDPLVEAILSWAEKQRAHNPSFRLVIGKKSFSIDQIVEHIKKDTEDGKLLKQMIFKTATNLFFDYRPR